MAEAEDLKSSKCGFDPHSGHFLYVPVTAGFNAYPGPGPILVRTLLVAPKSRLLANLQLCRSIRSEQLLAGPYRFRLPQKESVKPGK